jgi:hypothetical protein
MPLEIQERYNFGVVWHDHRYPLRVGTTLFWFPRDPAEPTIWFDTASVTGGTIATGFPFGGAILGPDGYIWGTPWGDNRVVRINPASKTFTVQDIANPFDLSTPLGGRVGRWGVASHNGANRIVARWIGDRELPTPQVASRIWLHIDTSDLSAVMFHPPPYNNSQLVSDTIYVPHNNTIYGVPKYQDSGKWIYVYPLVSPYNLLTDPVSIITIPGVGARYGSQMWLGQDGTTIYFARHSVLNFSKIDTMTNTFTLYGHTPWVHLGGGVHVGVSTVSTSPAVRFDESTETFTTLSTLPRHRPGGVLGGNGRAYWGRDGYNNVTEYDPATDLFSPIYRQSGSDMLYFDEPVNVGGNVYFLEQNPPGKPTRVAWLNVAQSGASGIYMDGAVHL